MKLDQAKNTNLIVMRKKNAKRFWGKRDVFENNYIIMLGHKFRFYLVKEMKAKAADRSGERKKTSYVFHRIRGRETEMTGGNEALRKTGSKIKDEFPVQREGFALPGEIVYNDPL